MSKNGWVLDKTYKFTEDYDRFYTLCDKITSVCGSKGKISCKWSPYLKVIFQPNCLDNEALVCVSCLWVLNHYYDRNKDYFSTCSSWPKRAHTFKSNKRLVFDFEDCEGYLPPSLHLFTLVEFFKKQETAAELNLKEIQKRLNSKAEATKQTKEIVSGEFSDDLSRNFKHLFEDGSFSDLTINCGKQVFRTHKNILFARSPVFAAMLKRDMAEMQTYEMNIDDAKPEVFGTLLTYMYSGESPQLPCLSIDTIIEIHVEADKYMLSGLKKACVEKLLSSLKPDNALDILVLADIYVPEIRKVTLQFVCSQYEELKNSLDWMSLKERNPSLIIEIMEAKYEKQKVNDGKN